MPSKEYTRMIALGEWLEKYLDPAIKTWEYRELAQNAFQIYDIDPSPDQITPEYALPDLVRFIEKQPDKDKLFYKKGLNSDKYAMIGEGTDPLNLKNQKVMPIIPGISQKEDHNLKRYIRKCAECCLEVYWFQTIAKQLFKRVSTMDRWEDAFLSDGTNIEYAYAEIPEHYPKLFQEIGIDNATRDIRVLNSITPRSRTTEISNGMPLKSSLNFFPWNVLVSRIVMDFLFAGGHAYFLFCEQCGKLTVVRRQTRKKFCSNTCRTRYRRSQGL